MKKREERAFFKETKSRFRLLGKIIIFIKRLMLNINIAGGVAATFRGGSVYIYLLAKLSVFFGVSRSRRRVS